MLAIGTALRTDSGRKIRVGEMLGGGAQGQVYVADDGSGKRGVLKLFQKRYATSDTVRRMRYLIDRGLPAVCPVLVAPVDTVTQGGVVAHYAPFAEGVSLEEFLGDPSATFSEQLQLAIAFAHAMTVLHGLGIAHGDLHSENLLVKRAGSALMLSIIDLDNFNAAGLPSPPAVGHTLYMAPELRAALAKGEVAIPTVATDRFAMGVLFHEMILLRHPSHGNDDSQEHFEKAMCSGHWLLDPAATDLRTETPGGYPSLVLNADLARLFRHAMSLDPSRRPSADVWKAELLKALRAVHVCPRPECGAPCVIDVSKRACPMCGETFPHLTLRMVASGNRIILDKGVMVIGRNTIGDSMKLSARHAVLRRIGPETWIECLGRNGTFRWNGATWVRLPEGKPLLVQAGDRLRFADVEGELK